ncbi:MAG: hypothetical protein IJT81_08165 [Lachnospiraceae bacterium]|nr:hypothetical protein [Lachnospiraceae bacterium]
MKKKHYTIVTSLLLLIICIVTILLAKPLRKSPTLYMLTSSNSAPNVENATVKIAEEYKWWNGSSFISESAINNSTINFDNTTYIGTYQYSKYNNYDSFETDYYCSADVVMWGLNATNGELVYINLKTPSFFEKEPLLQDVDNIKEIGLELAQKYASLFINLNDYILYNTRRSPYQPDRTQKAKMVFYTYTFVKKINNECSSAYISVQITSKGNLASIVIGDLNAFSDQYTKQIDSFKDLDIDNLVISELKSITKELDSPTFDITNKYYALNPEGKIVICVTAKCSYYIINDQNERESAGFIYEFVIK